jgi:hypothetical protein
MLDSFEFLFQFPGPFFPFEQLGKIALQLINVAFFFPQSVLPEKKAFLQLPAILLQLTAFAFLELDDAY